MFVRFLIFIRRYYVSLLIRSFCSRALAGLQQILRGHTFVGAVDRHTALIQHGTGLFAANTTLLLYVVLVSLFLYFLMPNKHWVLIFSYSFFFVLRHIRREMIYQEVLRRFQRCPFLRLSEPAPIYDLLIMALDRYAS